MNTKRRPALDTYVLDDQGNPVVEQDILRWSVWYGRAKNRLLKQDRVAPGVLVSSSFLGIHHSFIFRGRSHPILWETMVIGGPHDRYCQHYATREEALAGHASAVNIAKGGQ